MQGKMNSSKVNEIRVFGSAIENGCKYIGENTILVFII